MTTTIAAKRCRWWRLIGYEVSMLRGLRGSQLSAPSEAPARTAWLLGNIITEGQVLHTRILCDFCIPKYSDDLRPDDLFDNYDTEQKYDTLKRLIEHLKQEYGENKNGDARWAFNKMLAHLSRERNDEGFDYTPYLNRVLSVLEKIISEIETLRGYSFPELPETTPVGVPTFPLDAQGGHTGPYSR